MDVTKLLLLDFKLVSLIFVLELGPGIRYINWPMAFFKRDLQLTDW